ncbi:MAG: helix-turn-helix domain-containing protein [Acidobacteriota bacterium]
MEKSFRTLSIKEKLEIICEEMVEKNLLIKEALKEFEKVYIEKALKKNKGNKKKASKSLGIHRNTLIGKINSLKIKQR